MELKGILELAWPVVVIIIGFIIKDAIAKNDLKHKDKATDKEIELINKRLEESEKRTQDKIEEQLASIESKLEDRLRSLSKIMELQEKINQAQEAQITTNKENNIRNREKHQNLAEKVESFTQFISEENRDLKINQTQTTKAIIQLEVTLKGLADIIKHKM